MEYSAETQYLACKNYDDFARSQYPERLLKSWNQWSDSCQEGWLRAAHFELMLNSQQPPSLSLPEQALAPNPKNSFQLRVARFMLKCFGTEISNNLLERADRFLEEALELVQAIYILALIDKQSGGYCDRLAAANAEGKARANTLVNQYVFDREPGKPFQEIGGVKVTLAALCLAAKYDMYEAGETELARIMQPEVMEKIRKKQAAKNDIHGASP